MRDTRKRIVQAAITLAQEQGTRGLTMEAVAEAAGVSKGGLFHHFASKDELLCAIIDESIAVYQRQIETKVAAGEDYVEVFLEHVFAKDQHSQPFMRSLLAAAAEDPQFARTAQSWFQAWERRLQSEGLTAAQAGLLTLVANGLFIERALDLGVRSPDQVGPIHELLVRCIRPDSDEIMTNWLDQAVRAAENGPTQSAPAA